MEVIITLDQICLNDEKIGKIAVAEYLESLSDSQLEEYFKDVLQFTRPDKPTAIYQEKRSPSSRKLKQMSELQQLFLNMSPEKRAALEKLSKENEIDLEDLIQ